jgi:hypothetical protein
VVAIVIPVMDISIVVVTTTFVAAVLLVVSFFVRNFFCFVCLRVPTGNLHKIGDCLDVFPSSVELLDEWLELAVFFEHEQGRVRADVN